MLEVFTPEIETQIKDGLANLYWFRHDLKAAWMRSNVDVNLCAEIMAMKRDDGQNLSKRKMMDVLYDRLRTYDFNRRLEISRNFVRILIQHKNFVPQDEKHRIEVAEKCALKLKELIASEADQREERDRLRRNTSATSTDDYAIKREDVRAAFLAASGLPRQKRGYELEKILVKLMTISGIQVESGFRISGEQIDGAIKHDGHYYLLEAKWTEEKSDPKEIASFYYKVEGKLGGRGIFLSMNGYTDGVLASLPRGKEIRVLLLDGRHFTNVVSGVYRFQELLDHAIKHASLHAEIHCPPHID